MHKKNLIDLYNIYQNIDLVRNENIKENKIIKKLTLGCLIITFLLTVGIAVKAWTPPKLKNAYVEMTHMSSFLINKSGVSTPDTLHKRGC